MNAGHDHPFLVRGDGTLRDLDEGGTVLGLLEDSRYERGALAVEPGDVLVLFSDGLTDRTNAEGELFGVHRLKEAARPQPRGRRLDFSSIRSSGRSRGSRPASPPRTT